LSIVVFWEQPQVAAGIVVGSHSQARESCGLLNAGACAYSEATARRKDYRDKRSSPGIFFSRLGQLQGLAGLVLLQNLL